MSEASPTDPRAETRTDARTDARSDAAPRSPARLVVFGHDATPASLELHARGTRWRAFRALRVVAVVLVLAPLAALVPPHAPWALGVLVVGGLLAWRRWQERFTVRELRGRCPRCEAEVAVPGPVRLRSPHPVSCESCHHDATLRVEEDALP